MEKGEKCALYDYFHELKEYRLAHEISKSVMESNVIDNSDAVGMVAQNRLNYCINMNSSDKSKYKFTRDKIIRYLVDHFKSANPDLGDKVTVIYNAPWRTPNSCILSEDTTPFTHGEHFDYFSTIGNVLSRFESYYEYNARHANHGLYLDRCIYSPHVAFTSGIYAPEIYFCNIISTHFPNGSAALLNGVLEEKIKDSLEKRIDFILSVAAAKDTDILVLSDWGCEYHRYPDIERISMEPKLVAQALSNWLNTKYYNAFKQVIFCIDDADNIIVFRDIIKADEETLHGEKS